MPHEHTVLIFVLKVYRFERLEASIENIRDDCGPVGKSIFADDKPDKSGEGGIAGDSFHLVGFDDEPGGPKSPKKEFDVGGGEAGEVFGVPDLEGCG